MIEFEVKTEAQKEMIQAVKKFIKDFRSNQNTDQLQKEIKDTGNPSNMLSRLMKEATSGDLAKYIDSFYDMSKTRGIPVKLDGIRLLAMELTGGGTNGGASITKQMATMGMTKYGLTAMGLAAIASGKDGMKLIMSKYLKEIMNGNTFCYCITEPDAGTNTHKISTIATDEGDHYRLNGQKTFISAADESAYMVIIAKIVRDGEQEGIGTFVIDSKSEGISMTPLDIAVLGEGQFTIYFDNVMAPKDCQVGAKSKKSDKESSGISESVFYSLNLERIMIALGMLLLGRRILDKTIKKAKEKNEYGPSLGSNQNIKQKIAKVKIKLELGNLAARNATSGYDTKGDMKLIGMYANMAKLVATEAANEACEIAMNVYGVEGLNKDSDIGPLYQVARVFRVAPINDEMVMNFLGENLLGLPKSYK